jgi:uracil-DNA glycosylase
LDELRAAASICKGCDLWKPATQTVMGEGRAGAPLMLVGEQPGDREDLEGRPFVGPAGRLLDRALSDAGVDRSDVYLTNTVKHFKFVERGKRRIHKRPNQTEVHACAPWLEAEVAAVRPVVIVCLGATAAAAVVGPRVRVTRDRGRTWATDLGPPAMVTVHPSSILRSRAADEREVALEAFVDDLRGARAEWQRLGDEAGSVGR